MAVLNIDERYQENESKEDAENRSNTRSFWVELDNETGLGGDEARDAIGIPIRGDQSPYDSNSFFVDKQASRTDNRFTWIVVVNYSTSASSNTASGGGSQDPLEEDPLQNWNHRDIEIPVPNAFKIKDDGSIEPGGKVPVANSAKDAFTDPPLTEPSFIQVYNCTRNERPGSQFKPGKVPDFLNTVNKKDVSIGGHNFKKRTAWLIKYGAGNIQQRAGQVFVVVTYQILLATDIELGWDASILDQGLNELINGKKSRAKDDNGDAVDAPVNLDGSGKKLGNAEGDKAVFLRYRSKGEADFNSLKLPKKYTLSGK